MSGWTTHCEDKACSCRACIVSGPETEGAWFQLFLLADVIQCQPVCTAWACRYDAANHAKAHMLLTNRAEPGSDAATTALAALAAADPAAAAVAAAATVPGGPGRWLLPAADAGEVGDGLIAGIGWVGSLVKANRNQANK